MKNRVVKRKQNKKIVIALFKNLFSLIVLMFVLNNAVDHHPGYNWMWNKLINENLKEVFQYKNLSIDQRHEIKQGGFFNYLKAIKELTPDDAVILMPPDSIIDVLDEKYRLRNLKDRRKTTYFLYPRKAIYEKCPFDSLDKITHIAIFNYYGYNKLNYYSGDKYQFSVLPVKLIK